jgi:hypothetical protein
LVGSQGHIAQDNIFFRITYGSRPEGDGESSFQVHTPEGIMEFKPCVKGLHYLNLVEGDNDKMFVLWWCLRGSETLRDIRKGYTTSHQSQVAKEHAGEPS